MSNYMLFVNAKTGCDVAAAMLGAGKTNIVIYLTSDRLLIWFVCVYVCMSVFRFH